MRKKTSKESKKKYSKPEIYSEDTLTKKIIFAIIDEVDGEEGCTTCG